MKAPDAVEWQAAELAELQNHMANGSFREMNRGDARRRRLADSHGADFNVTGCLWVYKTKRDGRRKARLCLNGARQQEGVNYDQTYSSTLRHSSVRVLIAIQARLGLKSRRHDLVAAFLQGSLLDDEVVFMKYPPGHTEVGTDGKDTVYLVQKPIYGLKQAGRRFQHDFFAWLKLPIDQGGAGFTRCKKELCIFTRCVGNDTVYLGVYCDDIIAIFSDNDVGSVYDVFRTALHTRWKAEDEGELSDILNICVAHEGLSIKLSQPMYIDTMVDRYLPDDKLQATKEQKTPYSLHFKDNITAALAGPPAAHLPPDPALIAEYQSLVGALLYYSTVTWPDIAYPVAMLCRCISRPTPALLGLGEAQSILAYLHHTRDLGLCYTSGHSELETFTDSDWATRRSTSGNTVQWQGCTMEWAFTQQTSVALSSCEAEIMAASEAAKSTSYYPQLFEELGFATLNPTTIYMDNKAAVDLAYNQEHHRRTKHITRRHFFIRELVEDQSITVPYIRSADNIADFFTKILSNKDFFLFRLRDIIMNIA